jgi:hypothetical protein
MTNTAITMTAFKRTNYFKTVLNSIKNSMDYCRTYLPIYISIDYYSEEIPTLVKSIDWTEIHMLINNPSVGCNQNTRNAISYGLSIKDSVIHIEDDTVMSKDAIKFFVDMLKMFHDDSSIVSVTGYNRTISLDLDNKSDFSKIEQQNHFTCWGAAFWKHKADILLDNWIQTCNKENSSISWDSHINDNIFIPNKLYQVKPMISRIQNIGAEDGTWVPSAGWHYDNHRSPFTSDDLLS